jgi:predicted RNA binding protein YcfA (HicA-like mRNA interferase family)
MKLPLLSSKQVCKFLEKLGFNLIRQRGSHCYFKHNDGRITVVPIHSDQKIGRGLFRRILNEIQMSRDEFEKLWKK